MNHIVHEMGINPNQPTPQIFDRQTYALRQTRAQGTARRAAHDFMRPVLASLDERLGFIQRDFPRAAILEAQHLPAHPMPALARKTQTRIGISSASALPSGAFAKTLTQKKAMPTERVPLAPASCDVILSLWGLHIINDTPGVLRQILHALAPDGVFLAALPAGESLRGVRQAFLQAETELEGGAAAHVHPFPDMQQLGALLQRAGFAMPVVDKEAHFLAAGALARLQQLRSLGESNCLSARRRGLQRRATWRRALELMESAPDIIEVHYLLGWAPAPNQPQPLKPGSARASLAGALGAEEKPLS